MFYEVIPAKSIGQNSVGVLTYSSDLALEPGSLVLIPLRRSKIPGIVLRKVSKVDFKTKPIEKLLYPEPLPGHLLKTLLWLSDYYLVSLPQVASLLLPSGLEKRHQIALPPEPSSLAEKVDIPLNSAQKQALKALQSVETNTRLLHGVTGSGKTNIYLKLAEEALKSGKSVILLVPEIALTSQLVQVFEATFGPHITLIHSRQTGSERRDTWEALLKSSKPRIVIGPRSALFAPLKNLGLILIDESHETAYYQENSPRYSALKLASFIATTLKIPCLQGSATPLVSDYFLARQNHAVVKLTTKAKSTAISPSLKVIDLTDRANFSRSRYFSTPLLNALKSNLENGRQTLIFHNRRGSAPLTLCENCGWQALCPTCFLPLTLHSDLYRLVCHTCGRQEPVPLNCPECKTPGVVHKGFGTKLLESELKKLFKEANIARFDADNTKSESLDALYSEVKSGKIDILIGTQTLAKGLDLPLLATVGVVQADAGLNLPDYAAEERTFHLLTQVIGRVGRGHLDTAEVFIQTYQPDHPAITCALAADYDRFSDYLLKNRHKAGLPPYTYLAKLTLIYKTEATVLRHLKEYHAALSEFPGVTVSAPTPAFHERSSQGFIWQLVVKSTSRKVLISALKSLKPCSSLHLYLDPPSLI